jgi:hypothetical protein
MVWNPFKRRAGGKEANMAEAGTTPPAGGAIDYDKLGAAIAGALATPIQTAVTAAVAEANKPVAEALTKLQPQQPAATQQGQGQGGAGGGDKAKPLTEQDVARIVGDQLKSFQQTTQQGQARERYQAEKLKDLPVAYRNQLGSDPAKWAQEEQQIREQFKTDFKGLGGTTPNVGGDNPGGTKPAATAADVSKMSAVDKIELGLRGSKPQTTTTPAAGGGGTTAGAAQ